MNGRFKRIRSRRRPAAISSRCSKPSWLSFRLVAQSVFLWAMALSTSAETLADAPWNATTEIIGGSNAASGEFPYHIMSASNVLCGASLIHPDIALTAAHCLGAFREGVWIGSHRRDDSNYPGVFRAVTREIPHPNFVQASLFRDIMILQLASPVASPTIPWTRSSVSLPVGYTVTAMGFGYTTPNGNAVRTLQKVNIPVVSDAICVEQYLWRVDIDTAFCAGETGKGSCFGDSGSPLVDPQTKIQVGIVSGGIGCAQPNFPALYTRVGVFAPWIESMICRYSTVPLPSCSSDGPTTALPPAADPATPAPPNSSPRCGFLCMLLALVEK